MKRTMIVLGALMMLSSLIFAQKKERPHGQREGHLERLKTELSLSDAQYASIKGINKKYAEQFSQIRKDSVTTRKDKHTTLKGLREKRQSEINSVLSPEQKTKLETLKKQRAEKRKEHQKARAEKHGAQMINKLSLTDDQAAKLKAENKSFFEKVLALRSSNNKEANKAEMKKLRKDHEDAVKSILTTEQFSKWKDMRKEAKIKRKGK
jgi:Spy/CpxP family protein refolding chaperone